MKLKLRQTATVWSKNGVDGFGKTTFAAPATKLVRWEDKQEKIINAAGEEIMSMAEIFVGEDFNNGDYFCLGDQTSEADPMKVEAAYEIQKTEKIPDLKGTTFVRTVWI